MPEQQYRSQNIEMVSIGTWSSWMERTAGGSGAAGGEGGAASSGAATGGGGGQGLGEGSGGPAGLQDDRSWGVTSEGLGGGPGGHSKDMIGQIAGIMQGGGGGGGGGRNAGGGGQGGGGGGSGDGGGGGGGGGGGERGRGVTQEQRARSRRAESGRAMQAGEGGHYGRGDNAYGGRRETPVSDGSRAGNARAVRDEMRRQGMSDRGTAGIMANIQDESRFKGGMKEKNPTGAAKRLGGGHGLYQFTGEGKGQWGRYKNWMNRNYPGQDWRNPTLQTRYVAEELKSGRHGAGLWNRIDKAPTKERAAQEFLGTGPGKGYERPREDHRRNRAAKYGRGVPGIEHYTGGGGRSAEPGQSGGGRPTARGDGQESGGGSRAAQIGGGRTGDTGGRWLGHRAKSTPSSDGVLHANTLENKRVGGRSTLHGNIKIGDNTYPFVTGGKGRGSAPYGDYKLGGAVNRPKLGGAAFPMSNKHDPNINSTRGALFVHRGGPKGSLGCLHIPPGQFKQFQRDVQRGGFKTLRLQPGGGDKK